MLVKNCTIYHPNRNGHKEKSSSLAPQFLRLRVQGFNASRIKQILELKPESLHFHASLVLTGGLVGNKGLYCIGVI